MHVPRFVVCLDELWQGGRSRKEGGTGLGLIIARAGVEAHGGRIVFETTEDNGVRATVLLPVADRPARGGVAEGFQGGFTAGGSWRGGGGGWCVPTHPGDDRRR